MYVAECADPFFRSNALQETIGNLSLAFFVSVKALIITPREVHEKGKHNLRWLLMILTVLLFQLLSGLS
jgi:hypothetical protein